MQRMVGAAATCVLAATVMVPRRAAGQESFRTSLTATVSRLPETDTQLSEASGADSDEATEATLEAAPDAAINGGLLLRCRRVTLHWAPLADARRYTVYVSVSGHDGWMPLAPRNACGESRVTGSTTMVDIEPTTGGATVVRRIYYRVEAFDRAGRGARLIATTMSVPAELR